jgi:hypothetical protein
MRAVGATYVLPARASPISLIISWHLKHDLHVAGAALAARPKLDPGGAPRFVSNAALGFAQHPPAHDRQILALMT